LLSRKCPVAEAGVDMMVAGSAILKEPRTMEAYKETIDAMWAERKR
jgi:ribulose-phosphate 3-epimerase